MYVADYYLNEKIVKKNVEKATELLDRIVKMKDHDFGKAAFKLGEIYDKEEYGKKMRKWLRCIIIL